jgi:pimeloyl-ACP methyl ester carboxylesterase
VPTVSLGDFWAPQIPELARDFRVIVHDHRGADRSRHSRIPYSAGHFAPQITPGPCTAAIAAFLRGQADAAA